MKGFDKDGRKVFLFQTGQIDPEKHKLDEIYRLHYLFMEILMDQCDQSSVTGFISMSENKGTTLGHVTLFSNPVFAKKSATVFQDAYPSRPKAMHLLNMPAFFETVLNMFKSFLNEKMRNRFQVHPMDDYTTLQEQLGKDILPEEFGGTNGKLQDHISMTFCLTFYFTLSSFFLFHLQTNACH